MRSQRNEVKGLKPWRFPRSPFKASTNKQRLSGKQAAVINCLSLSITFVYFNL